jgi:hypothetical protein
VRIPVVKEHGSWVVFILSAIIAIIAGIETSKDPIPYYKLSLTISGLALLINSKKPLASALRGTMERTSNIYWFLIFSISGLLMLVPFLIDGIMVFSIFIPLIALYTVLLYMGKEHSLISELTGFSLLCITAPAVYFVLTGELSLRLYLMVLLFFAAGIFKVRLRMRKRPLDRIVMILYCLGVFMIFRYLDLSTIILIPLSENTITALWIREEGLKTTGQIELFKGVVFVLLFLFYGRPHL